MKKYISILLIALVAITCLVSCDHEIATAASTPTPEQPVNYEAEVKFAYACNMGSKSYKSGSYYVAKNTADFSTAVTLYDDADCTVDSGHTIKLKKYSSYFYCDLDNVNPINLTATDVSNLTTTTFDTSSDTSKFVSDSPAGLVTIKFHESGKTYTVAEYIF